MYRPLLLLQVSNQLSVLVARIARLDCPDKWPELLPHLTEVTLTLCTSAVFCFSELTGVSIVLCLLI